MNTPTLINRRSFLSTLTSAATVAAAAPLAAALPSLPPVEVESPKRASVPLEWRTSLFGLPNEAAAFIYGTVWIGVYYTRSNGQTQWVFGSAQQQTIGHCDTADQARATIQAKWDELCGTEPSEPIVLRPTKVKMLEWRPCSTLPDHQHTWDGYSARTFVGSLQRLDDNSRWVFVDRDQRPHYYHVSLEAAKAAAQSHWEAMVLGALEQ